MGEKVILSDFNNHRLKAVLDFEENSKNLLTSVLTASIKGKSKGLVKSAFRRGKLSVGTYYFIYIPSENIHFIVETEDRNRRDILNIYVGRMSVLIDPEKKDPISSLRVDQTTDGTNGYIPGHEHNVIAHGCLMVKVVIKPDGTVVV